MSYNMHHLSATPALSNCTLTYTVVPNMPLHDTLTAHTPLLIADTWLNQPLKTSSTVLWLHFGRTAGTLDRNHLCCWFSILHHVQYGRTAVAINTSAATAHNVDMLARIHTTAQATTLLLATSQLKSVLAQLLQLELV
jgi:hypothetical protein